MFGRALRFGFILPFESWLSFPIFWRFQYIYFISTESECCFLRNRFLLTWLMRCVSFSYILPFVLCNSECVGDRFCPRRSQQSYWTKESLRYWIYPARKLANIEIVFLGGKVVELPRGIFSFFFLSLAYWRPRVFAAVSFDLFLL